MLNFQATIIFACRADIAWDAVHASSCHDIEVQPCSRAAVAPVPATIAYRRINDEAAVTYGEIEANDAAYPGYRESINMCMNGEHVPIISPQTPRQNR